MQPAVKKPTLSAILLNYNHAAYLPQALDTILGQTVAFNEVLVIDDSSTDTSVAVITEQLAGMATARLIQNPQNLGVMQSANLGIHEATGDYVFFFAADDTYPVQLVEWFHAFLQEHPQAAIIAGKSVILHTNTEKSQEFTPPYPPMAAMHPPGFLETIGHKRALTFLGGPCLIRRDALAQIGGYQPSLRWHADWFLNLILSHRHGFGYIPKQIVTFRIAADQYSQGRHDWTQQKIVIEALLELLKGDFAADYEFFRRNAVLPTYDPRILLLLMQHKIYRNYLTPLLIYRLLTYNFLRKFSRLIPIGLHNYIRQKLWI